MEIRYILNAAGIEAGTIKFLPDALALELMSMGIVEPVTPQNNTSTVEVAQVPTESEKTQKTARKRAKK